MSTIEKRVSDLEYIIAHLPEDLDARFAGVDTKLATIREVLALHTTRFSTVELRLDNIERRFDKMDGRLDKMDDRFDKMDGKLDTLSGQVAQILDRLSH
jgi:chromosome segregation ATPase